MYRHIHVPAYTYTSTNHLRDCCILESQLRAMYMYSHIHVLAYTYTCTNHLRDCCILESQLRAAGPSHDLNRVVGWVKAMESELRCVV